MNPKENLFNETLSLGDRRYDFEVKQSRIGTYYLSIKEIRNGKKQKLIVFESHLKSFFKKVQKAYTFIANKKAHRMNSTSEELRKAFNSGKSIPEIALYFGKSEQDICARLVKMGELSADDGLSETA